MIEVRLRVRFPSPGAWPWEDVYADFSVLPRKGDAVFAGSPIEEAQEMFVVADNPDFWVGMSPDVSLDLDRDRRAVSQDEAMEELSDFLERIRTGAIVGWRMRSRGAE